MMGKAISKRTGWTAKSLIAIALALTGGTAFAGPRDAIAFWDQPQHGANSFNAAPPDLAYFQALRATGATWVRLAFSKWPSDGRDFLIGDADHYTGLNQTDLKRLLATIDLADRAGLKIVVAPLSLPGNRWKQQNDQVDDERLWRDKGYWAQAATFWTDLALALKDRPGVVALNIVNEPNPERLSKIGQGDSAGAIADWIAAHRDRADYLPGFYAAIAAAIRRVDANAPIMVDSGWYGNTLGFDYWPTAIPGGNILYAFHMYEPYEATGDANLTRKPQLRYPGAPGWIGSEQVTWNRAVMTDYLARPFKWAAAHGISANRVVAGEYGCMRQWRDCGAYLGDVLDTLDRQGAHWAFYSFREDAWDGMNYELGPNVAASAYYDAVASGDTTSLYTGQQPLLDIVEAHMARPGKANAAN